MTRCFCRKNDFWIGHEEAIRTLQWLEQSPLTFFSSDIIHHKDLMRRQCNYPHFKDGEIETQEFKCICNLDSKLEGSEFLWSLLLSLVGVRCLFPLLLLPPETSAPLLGSKIFRHLNISWNIVLNKHFWCVPNECYTCVNEVTYSTAVPRTQKQSDSGCGGRTAQHLSCGIPAGPRPISTGPPTHHKVPPHGDHYLISLRPTNFLEASITRSFLCKPRVCF